MTAVNSIYFTLPGTITLSHLVVNLKREASREQWRQPSTSFPCHIVCQFQSTYMRSLCGPLPRHIVRQFQSPYIRNHRAVYHESMHVITLSLAWCGIGFTFLPHVIVPDKRHRVHCMTAHGAIMMTWSIMMTYVMVDILYHVRVVVFWCHHDRSWCHRNLCACNQLGQGWLNTI
jgi:hypothetical protein